MRVISIKYDYQTNLRTMFPHHTCVQKYVYLPRATSSLCTRSWWSLSARNAFSLRTPRNCWRSTRPLFTTRNRILLKSWTYLNIISIRKQVFLFSNFRWLDGRLLMADGWCGEALGGRGRCAPRLHHHQQCLEQGDKASYLHFFYIFKLFPVFF